MSDNERDNKRREKQTPSNSPFIHRTPSPRRSSSVDTDVQEVTKKHRPASRSRSRSRSRSDTKQAKKQPKSSRAHRSRSRSRSHKNKNDRKRSRDRSKRSRSRDRTKRSHSRGRSKRSRSHSRDRDRHRRSRSRDTTVLRMELDLLRKDKELDREKHKHKCNLMLAKFEKDKEKASFLYAKLHESHKTTVVDLHARIAELQLQVDRAQAAADDLRLSAEQSFKDPTWALTNPNPYMANLPEAHVVPPGMGHDMVVLPPDDKWAGKYMDPSKWIDTKRLNDGWQMWRHTEISPDDDWAQSPYWEGTPYYLMSNPAVRCYSDNVIKYATSDQLQDEANKHALRKANAKRKREDQAKKAKHSKALAEKAAAPVLAQIKPKLRPMKRAMNAANKKASKTTVAATTVVSSSSPSSSSSNQAPPVAADSAPLLTQAPSLAGAEAPSV